MMKPGLWVSVSDKYWTGKKGFIDAVLKIAHPYLPESQIHHERFDAIATIKATITAGAITESKPIEVEIRSSAETLQVPAGHTRVEVLQPSGLPIARNSPRGFCGGYAVTVLAGGVEHRDMSLPDQRRNVMGKILSGASHAKSSRRGPGL